MTASRETWRRSHQGDEKTAAEQYDAARALYTRHRGPDHPDTLATANKLANIYHSLGRYAEALKLHEETLARRRIKLGPDHPDTLRSMDNLASCYRALGRYTEALKLTEETLALTKAKFGPDHPDTLTCMQGLGHCYAVLG
jgi:tetratricopeptide (TPR) repeat protein